MGTAIADAQASKDGQISGLPRRTAAAWISCEPASSRDTATNYSAFIPLDATGPPRRIILSHVVVGRRWWCEQGRAQATPGLSLDGPLASRWQLPHACTCIRALSCSRSLRSKTFPPRRHVFVPSAQILWRGILRCLMDVSILCGSIQHWAPTLSARFALRVTEESGFGVVPT
jgi:hypothetical protein